MENADIIILFLLSLDVILHIWLIVEERGWKKEERQFYNKNSQEIEELLKEMRENNDKLREMEEKLNKSDKESSEELKEDVPTPKGDNIKNCGHCEQKFDWRKGRCPCYDSGETICGICKEPIEKGKKCENLECPYNRITQGAIVGAINLDLPNKTIPMAPPPPSTPKEEAVAKITEPKTKPSEPKEKSHQETLKEALEKRRKKIEGEE